MNRLNMNPETICNFYVDEQRKKIWQIELDMLEELDNICKKNNIKYSLAGGSLLGAIRHRGFIPWDDDIDVVMLREDYERFIKEALESKYFIQCSETEKGYYYGHAQIRNSETTAIIKVDRYNRFNHGIFLDIFPIDNVPDDLKEQRRYTRKILYKKRFIIFNAWKNYQNKFTRLIKSIMYKVLWGNKTLDDKIQEYNKLCKKYNNIETKQCGAIGFRPNEFKYEKKWLTELKTVKFEYLDVQISEYYDEWLRRQYGDYMKIPKDKHGSLHGDVFFDTEKSYKEYADYFKDK